MFDNTILNQLFFQNKSLRKIIEESTFISLLDFTIARNTSGYKSNSEQRLR